MLEYHCGILHHVTPELSCELVIEFVKRGLDPNYIDEDGYSVFSKCETLGMVNELVELGANPELLGPTLSSVLDRPWLTKFLLENVARFDKIVGHWHPYISDSKSYKILVDHGIDEESDENDYSHFMPIRC